MPLLDDFAATTATTGRVAVGGSATGTINSRGDQDWFRISLNAGQQITVDLEGSPTSQGTLSDPYLRGIYNSSGTLLANTTDDDSGTGFNSRVSFTADSTGDYYISAGGYGSGTGTYRLDVSPADDFAATTATTGRVAVGGSATGTINSSGDQDWFRISLNAGQQITVDLEGRPTSRGTLSDPYLRGIYTSSGTLLANTANDDSGTSLNSRVSFTAGSRGYYYISAGGYGSGTGTYRLGVNAGNNIQNSRTGNDTLTGGAGADVFRFVRTSDGIDRITNFQSGTDTIQVVRPNFGNIRVGTLASNRFRAAGTALTNRNAVFIYNSTTGGLSFDRDGNGGAAAVQIATLTGRPTLTASDIQVVAA